MGLSWNLAAFGALALWAAGVSGTSAALSLKGEGRPSAPWVHIVAAVLLIAGAVAAVFGMQRPDRIFNLLGNPAAAITQQVYAAIALACALAAWAVIRIRLGSEQRWLSVVELVLAAVLVVAVGRRFLIPSAPLLNTWLQLLAGIGFAAAAGALTVLALDTVSQRSDQKAQGSRACIAACAAMWFLMPATWCSSR